MMADGGGECRRSKVASPLLDGGRAWQTVREITAECVSGDSPLSCREIKAAVSMTMHVLDLKLFA
jgi:hypothetical protein